MNPIQQAGVGLLFISAGVFLFMIARVLYGAAKGEDLNMIPVEVYSGISIAVCVAGIGLLVF